MRPALFFFCILPLFLFVFSLSAHNSNRVRGSVNECGTATLSSGEAAMSKIRAQWHLFGLMNDWEPSNLWHFPSIYKIFTTNCCCCRCSLDCIAWALFFSSDVLRSIHLYLYCVVLFGSCRLAADNFFVLVKQSAKSNENDSFASHINYYHFFFIWL